MHSPVLTIISFIVIFTVVVVSHEFGHFIIARLNGINVSEFTIGMGPALFKKKGKNTTFAIRLLPIGGACIFEGEPGYGGDEEDEDKNEENEKDEEDEEGFYLGDYPSFSHLGHRCLWVLFGVLSSLGLRVF